MITIKNDSMGRAWIHLNSELNGKGYVFNGIYYTLRYRKASATQKSHFYNIGQGYPIDYDILIWLKDHDIYDIVVVEKSMDGDKKYKSTIEKYLKADGYNDFDWGYGRQMNLPLMEMEVIS